MDQELVTVVGGDLGHRFVPSVRFLVFDVELLLLLLQEQRLIMLRVRLGFQWLHLGVGLCLQPLRVWPDHLEEGSDVRVRKQLGNLRLGHHLEHGAHRLDSLGPLQLLRADRCIIIVFLRILHF